jgi:hypothetical protein
MHYNENSGLHVLFLLLVSVAHVDSDSIGSEIDGPDYTVLASEVTALDSTESEIR